jgi:MarR family transcriptional regulator, lower aerobic nicotinate degradation pathway regulator
MVSYCMGSHIITATTRPKQSDTRLVLDAIRRIVQTLRVASRAAESQFGLTAAQLFVLQRLAESTSASVNELAGRTLTHQSSVSVVVSRLVARGLVARSTDRADARRVVLTATAKGRALVRRAPAAAQERLIDAIDDLSAPKRQELATLLARVADHAADTAAPPALFFEEPKVTKGNLNGSR